MKLGLAILVLLLPLGVFAQTPAVSTPPPVALLPSTVPIVTAPEMGMLPVVIDVPTPTTWTQEMTQADRHVLEATEPVPSEFDKLRYKNGVVFELVEPTREERIILTQLSENELEAFYEHRHRMLWPIGRIFAVFGTGMQGFFQRRISSLSSSLYQSAKVVANASEFGVEVSGGGMGGAQVLKWGFHPIVNVGLLSGFDYQQRKVTIDLFLDIKTLRTALPVVAQVAISTNLMAYAGNKRNLSEKGVYFSPPSLPIATQKFESMFAAGWSMGWGLPPLDWLYAYTANVRRVTLLRLEIPFVIKDGEPKYLLASAFSEYMGRILQPLIEKGKSCLFMARKPAP